MNFQALAKQAQRFTVDNSPTILTVMGVTGVVTTAYFTATATFKAAEILRQEEDAARFLKKELTLKDKVNHVWTLYLPAVAFGALTITSVIGANRIGTRRAAAMAAAYTLSEKAISEYKDKVVEKIGEKKATLIKEEVAQDRVNKNPTEGRNIIVAGPNEVLCYEMYTDRYFMSSMEALKKGQNDLNYRILNTDGYASLGDFYDLVGLPRTSIAESLGWTADKLLELDFSATVSDKGEPCLAFDYQAEPIRKYYRHG